MSAPYFPFDYAPGYDPSVDQRHSIGQLPDDAWGSVVNGLQAALNTPRSIKYNEKVPLYLVIRNVSRAKIHFTLCEPTGSVRLILGDDRALGKPAGRGGHVQPPKHHELQPGYQTLVFCTELMIREKDSHVPNFGGFGGVSPGTYLFSVGCGNRDRSVWIDGVRHPIERAEDEWVGWLDAAKRPVEVLAESVTFEAVVPPEFPEDHGVSFTTRQPPGIQSSSGVRSGLNLYSRKESSEYWLQDHANYERSIFWGPMSAEDLVELGIFKIIEKNVRTAIARGREKFPRKRPSLSGLLTGPKPFAALGFELLMEEDLAEHFARTIRGGRLRYIEMGLEKEMRLALAQAELHQPPLPDRSEFQVVTKSDLPPDLRNEAWGSADDGLRAAALMPEVVTEGRSEQVRLFIQNVSGVEIHLNNGNEDLRGAKRGNREPGTNFVETQPIEVLVT